MIGTWCNVDKHFVRYKLNRKLLKMYPYRTIQYVILPHSCCDCKSSDEYGRTTLYTFLETATSIPFSFLFIWLMNCSCRRYILNVSVMCLMFIYLWNSIRLKCFCGYFFMIIYFDTPGMTVVRIIFFTMKTIIKSYWTE